MALLHNRAGGGDGSGGGMFDRFTNDPFRRDHHTFSDSDSAFGNSGVDYGWQSTAGSTMNSFAPYHPEGTSPVVGFPLLDLINSLWDGHVRSAISWVDVKESPSAYVFSADAPGFSREDLKVQVDEVGPGSRVLVISGQRLQIEAERVKTNYSNPPVIESAKNTFVRRFKLPVDVDPDSTSAHCEHGELTVIVPKVGMGGGMDMLELSQPGVHSIRIEEIESDDDEQEQQQPHQQNQWWQEQQEQMKGLEKTADGSSGGALGSWSNQTALDQMGKGGGGGLQDGVDRSDLNPEMMDMVVNEFPGTPSVEAMAAQFEGPVPRIVQVMSPMAVRTVEVVEMVEDESRVVNVSVASSHPSSGWRRLVRKLSTAKRLKWATGKSSKRR